MTDLGYVPTTDEIRRRASHDAARFGFLQELDFEAQFDRWLAAHDREATVARVNALLGVDLWAVRSFRADLRIDFHEDGHIIEAALLNGPTP